MARPTLASQFPPMHWIAAATFYPWMIGCTVCIGAFLGQLDASIAGWVLPTLATSFAAPLADVEWVAIAYLLALAALVVPFGRLCDLAGRKMLYTSGLSIFILGSALCGLAPDLTWLIVFRVLQAIGAVMLQANSVAIITAAVTARRHRPAVRIRMEPRSRLVDSGAADSPLAAVEHALRQLGSTGPISVTR